MNFNNILIDIEDSLAIVTLNRPDKLNALNRETLRELRQALEELRLKSDIRVLILTGSGPKAFVAGADISEFAGFDAHQGSELAQKGHDEVMNFIENYPKPIIAAINGFALGGGLELAMAAHIRLASENAKLGLPEVSLGVIPGYGGTQRLAQLVGKGLALEMVTSASAIDAQKAKEIGLVNEMVPQETLLDAAKSLAQKIAKNSPVAINYAIQAVNAGFQHDKNGYHEEIRLFGACFETLDFKEGTTAFLEKRKPSFEGK